MAIVDHKEIAQTRGYYSKIFNRTIVGPEQGAQTCVVWEQKPTMNAYLSLPPSKPRFTPLFLSSQ